MNIINSILNNSFGILDLAKENIDRLDAINALFLNHARQYAPNLDTLENLHDFLSEDEFTELHFSLNKLLHENQLLYPVFLNEEHSIKALFGNDVDLQSYPHLRISRPNIKEDNVGLHRDIEYGASIHEFSLWIPLHDIRKGSGMKIYPNSITAGYKGFSLEKKDTNFELGSKKNYSGFPYALNNVTLSESQRANLIEPNIFFGQVLLIPLLSVHGSEINSSEKTRWSIDIRVCSPYATDPRSTLEKRRVEIVNTNFRVSSYPYYRPLFRGLISKMIARFKDS